MKPIWQTPAVQDSLLAIGIVPPAMNLALSPETAVTVGSASVWATPCRSNACSVALKVLLPRAQFSVASVADQRAVDRERIVELEAAVRPAAAHA